MQSLSGNAKRHKPFNVGCKLNVPARNLTEKAVPSRRLHIGRYDTGALGLAILAQHLPNEAASKVRYFAAW